jgi:hypothetical protein
MIPYDDLVAALSVWRARQGLPVSTMGAPAAAAAAAPTSGPHGAPRTSPPTAPRGKPASVPRPLAHADADEVDAALLDDAAYENLSEDLGQGDGDLPTAINTPPTKETKSPRGGGRRGKDPW